MHNNNLQTLDIQPLLISEALADEFRFRHEREVIDPLFFGRQEEIDAGSITTEGIARQIKEADARFASGMKENFEISINI